MKYVEATVAQQAEQLICNQRVGGSIPFGGSRLGAHRGEVPERPKGADCKSAGAAFGGSNPPLSTSNFCGAKLAVKSGKLKGGEHEKEDRLFAHDTSFFGFNTDAGVAQW